jgi:phosphonate C-P lyase system protein PhnG
VKELHVLWIEARPEIVEQWAETLLEALGYVKVTVQPRPALVMMQAEDSIEGDRFCVGELLATECQISYEKQHFWGRVLGNEPVRALALALLAAAEARAPNCLLEMQPELDRERRFLEAQRLKLSRALGTTRVQFETMNPT